MCGRAYTFSLQFLEYFRWWISWHFVEIPPPPPAPQPPTNGCCLKNNKIVSPSSRSLWLWTESLSSLIACCCGLLWGFHCFENKSHSVRHREDSHSNIQCSCIQISLSVSLFMCLCLSVCRLSVSLSVVSLSLSLPLSLPLSVSVSLSLSLNLSLSLSLVNHLYHISHRLSGLCAKPPDGLSVTMR